MTSKNQCNRNPYLNLMQLSRIALQTFVIQCALLQQLLECCSCRFYLDIEGVFKCKIVSHLLTFSCNFTRLAQQQI